MLIIKKLQKAGHEIILNTSRNDFDYNTFEDAINYLNKFEELAPIKNHTKAKIFPEIWDWEIHKNKQIIFIDDYTIDIPTIETMKFHKKVDWKKIDTEFIENGLYQ